MVPYKSLILHFHIQFALLIWVNSIEHNIICIFQNSNGANDSKFCKYERRTTSDIKYGSNKIVNSCSTKKRKIYKYIF